MSNGKCNDRCSGSYAFAIIQGQNCWCSNQAPGSTTNAFNCNQQCPGYPYEWCGSTSANLYAYFSTGGTVTGTSGRSSTAAPASSSAPSVSTVPTTSTVSSPWAGSSSSGAPYLPIVFPFLTNALASQSSMIPSTSSVAFGSSDTLTPTSSSVCLHLPLLRAALDIYAIRHRLRGAVANIILFAGIEFDRSSSIIGLVVVSIVGIFFCIITNSTGRHQRGHPDWTGQHDTGHAITHCHSSAHERLGAGGCDSREQRRGWTQERCHRRHCHWCCRHHRLHHRPRSVFHPSATTPKKS